MTPNPRTIAGGLAAAVLGGGVTSAQLLAPNATSASTPTSTEVTSTDDTGGATDSESSSARSDALREALQPLVDAGALTAEQADAIVDELAALAMPSFNFELAPGDHLVPGRPGPELPGMPGGRHQDGPLGGRLRLFRAAEVVADAIGIDATDLVAQLAQGETVAEIAEANGVDPQTVVDALVDDYTERVTDWVNGDDGISTDDDETATTTPTTEAAA
jgi:hypothetical protein